VRFVTFITLLAITSSLLIITAATIPPYVYGTTAYMVSGPGISTTFEGSVPLAAIRPPATILDTMPAELHDEVTHQVSNLSVGNTTGENYVKALKSCLLSNSVSIEIRLVGEPRGGYVSVDGYVMVGSRRSDFHISVPGLGVTYVLFTNTSCADEMKIVVTNISTNTSSEALLNNLVLSYFIYASNNPARIVTAYQLIMQTVLTVIALVSLEVTRLKCRKYFL